MIGGATTSAKHTAVKIAPAYEHADDPRARRLARGGRRRATAQPGSCKPQFDRRNRAEQRQLAESYQQRQQVKLVPYDEAVAKRFKTDWQTVRIDAPSFLGRRVLDDFPLGGARPNTSIGRRFS